MKFSNDSGDMDIQIAPGTVHLQDNSDDKAATKNLIHSRDGSLVLYPQPTTDPNDPLNWSMWRKTVNFGFACLYTLFVYTMLDIGPVAWAVWNEELGISYENLSNSFASNTAALAVGCIVLVPLTVKYGRRPVYLATTLVLALSAVWMALQATVGDLIGNNILSGLAGSVGDVVVQLTVADMFFIHQRGTMNGIYVFMVNLGAFGAPVATGFIVENQSWPWMFWYCVIFLGILFVAMLFFYEETKFKQSVLNSVSQTHQAREIVDSEISKDKDVSKSLDLQLTGSSLPHGEPGSRDWIDRSIPMKNYRERHRFVTKTPGTFRQFTTQMFRPFEYLYWFPAVAYNAVQYGSMLSWLSVIGNSQAAIFSVDPYDFGPVGIGLIAIPALIGTMLGGVYGGVMSDWAIVHLSKRNGGIYEPEFRLYMCIPPALIGPAGIYLYGIGSSNGLPWIAPLIGIALFGFSLSSITNLNLVYLYDSYAEILGGALVVVSFVRNGLATAIVFAFNPWVAAMGYQNTFILCGSLALFFNLLSIPMIIWGKAWRIRFADKYNFYAAEDLYKNLGRS